MHGDFGMFSRVWRSIESLCLTSGLRKNYAREVGIRSVPQYQISPNFLFWGLLRGGRNRKFDYYAKIRYGRGKDIYCNIQLLYTYMLSMSRVVMDADSYRPVLDAKVHVVLCTVAQIITD